MQGKALPVPAQLATCQCVICTAHSQQLTSFNKYLVSLVYCMKQTAYSAYITSKNGDALLNLHSVALVRVSIRGSPILHLHAFHDDASRALWRLKSNSRALVPARQHPRHTCCPLSGLPAPRSERQHRRSTRSALQTAGQAHRRRLANNTAISLHPLRPKQSECNSTTSITASVALPVVTVVRARNTSHGAFVIF